ncbi:PREDICTED: uncharacterized protein LOC108780080 [Cyphomyrmex costatus]|uniref:uncharacterized protein LOC108780080 n=1 Tax=Cyphomyrmex costatus TaxID=456900 RepID=UPI00085223BE|nr:PREDICTED: uncharacterized protein LOC108780080 [Cyphomyrmex costatus]
MNNLREKFWIIQTRKAVRSVIHKCKICRRHSAKTMEAPPAVLPEDRVRDANTFEKTGIDFAGPLFLSDGHKAYICLFTCAVYRAIHIELVTTLSMEGFFEALRRFIARRGRPSIIYSDNGRNFVGASNLLKRINWKKIARHGAINEIEWYFNPPSAAWWGGWWERLIRILKDLLKRTLGRTSLNYEEMFTVLCDCEAVINSRSLTYMTEEAAEAVAITPAMFLQDIQEEGIPDLDQIGRTQLAKNLRYRQRLKEELRKRFRIQYLGQLSRWSKRKYNTISVLVGDIILVVNDLQKRINWPMARIKELFPGKDGIVRVVKLQTSDGELIRPIQKLIPLEMKLCDENFKRYADLVTPAIEVQDYPESTPELTTRTRSGRIIKKPERLEF